MKKQYEKNFGINVIFIIYILLIFFFIYIITTLKIVIYKTYHGIITEENVISIYIPYEEINDFYKVNCFYINNKKIKFKIKDVIKLKKSKGDVNYVFSNFKIISSNVYGTGESVTVSIQINKKKACEMFKIIWEGDNNKNN